MARTAAPLPARIEAVDDVGGAARGAGDNRGRHGVSWCGTSESLRDCASCSSAGRAWRQPVFAEMRRPARASRVRRLVRVAHGAQRPSAHGHQGQSTTASFLSHLLGRLGVNGWWPGNIGTPLSDLSPDRERGRRRRVVELAGGAADHLARGGRRDDSSRGPPGFGTVAPMRTTREGNVFRNGARSFGVHTRRDRRPAAHRRDPFPPSTAARRPCGGPQAGRHVRDDSMNTTWSTAPSPSWPPRRCSADPSRRTRSTPPSRRSRVLPPGCRPCGPGADQGDRRTLATTGRAWSPRSVDAPDGHVALIVGGRTAAEYDQVDAYLCSGAPAVSPIQAPEQRPTSAWLRPKASVGHARRWGPRRAVRVAAALPTSTSCCCHPCGSYDLFVNTSEGRCVLRLTTARGSVSRP